MKQNQVGIFFDRDRTSNTENNFLRKPEALGPIPHSLDGIRKATVAGVRVIIRSNQSEIARSFFAETRVSAAQKHLADLVTRRKKHVDAIYHCTHPPERGKLPCLAACRCRKSDIGMFVKAAAEFNDNLRKSIDVGDRCVDTVGWRTAACTPFLVLTRYGVYERNECITNTDVGYVVHNDYEARQQLRRTMSHRTTIRF